MHFEIAFQPTSTTQSIYVMNATYSILVALILGATQCSAVIMAGSNANTNRPSGGCGWDSVGKFGGGAGIVIGPHTFVTAQHVSGYPDHVFEIGGIQYPAISCHTNAGSDSRIVAWTVNGTFPPERISRIYTNHDEIGKEFVVIGRGPIAGQVVISATNEPSNTITITSMTFKRNDVKLNIVGGDPGRNFKVQWSTNLLQWNNESTTYTVTTSQSQTITLPRRNASSVFYRTAVTGVTVVTNGWLYDMTHTGELSWGKNTVDGFTSFSTTADNVQYADFSDCGGPLESAAGVGDSGGGMFILDCGEWKLAGIVESGDIGPYIDKEGNFLGWGAMQDQSGLWLAGIMNGVYEPFMWFPFEGGAKPTHTFYLRVSLEAGWLQSFCN